MHYEFLLGRLLYLRRYSDYKLLKQIIDYQNQRIKIDLAVNKLQEFILEPWMFTSNTGTFGGGLLDKIRNQTLWTALALINVFLFCLPIYAENVTGRVVENGSNYGVPNAQVELFVNGNTTPTTTQTNSQGNFSANPLGIIESTPVLLSSLDAVAGPNPGASKSVRFYVPSSGNVDIVVYGLVLGEEIKKLHSGELSRGTYMVDWDATNNHNQRVADGIYGILITSGIERKIIKTIIDKNGPVATGIEYKLSKEEKNNTSTRIELETWQLDSVRVSGATLEDITITGFQPQTGNYDIGNIGVNGTNIITGFVYDLDTKYSNRTGIPNLEIKLKSIPEKTHTTDNNGIFSFTTTVSGQDSLFINDDVYYNWKHPVNITQYTEVKAFNDTTGIPMIARYTDPENGEDLIEFTQNITDVRSAWLNDPIYKNTVARFKNNVAFVYLNRTNSPVSYYPDSSLAGLKYLENEKMIFIETTDSASAQIHMRYTNTNVGNGTNIQFASDEQGPYIKNWDINIRGPPGDPIVLRKEWVALVVAHEGEHALLSSGEHSAYMKDLIYGDVISRYILGFRDYGSEKEKKAWIILYYTERNSKLLEYTK